MNIDSYVENISLGSVRFYFKCVSVLMCVRGCEAGMSVYSIAV